MDPALERLARGERPVAEPGKTARKIVDGNSAHHDREHAEQVRGWRTSRGVLRTSASSAG